MNNSLAVLILSLTSANNSVRNDAEQRFEELKHNDPRTLLIGLIQIMTIQENCLNSSYQSDIEIESVRMLSAILLRGITIREKELWTTLSTSEVQSYRTYMLQSLILESTPHIRRKIADALISHAGILIWPELLASVQHLATSGVQRDLTLSMYLLEKLAETIGDYLYAHLDTLWSIIMPILAGSNGASVESSAAAAQALCSVLAISRDNSSTGHGASTDHKNDATGQWGTALSRSAVLASLWATEASHEAQAQDVLIALLRLAELQPGAFLSCHDDVMNSMLILAANRASNESHRSLALQLATEIATTITCRAEVTSDMREKLLHVIMRSCTEIDESEEATVEFLSDSSEEEDDSSWRGTVAASNEFSGSQLCDVAGGCLESMSQSLDPESLVKACLHSAMPFLQAPQWTSRHAVLFIITVICEGVQSALEPLLPHLTHAVLQCCSDPHPRVCYAAVRCISELIRHFRRPCTEVDTEAGEEDSTESCEDSDEEQKNAVEQNSFQVAFYSTVPPTLCTMLQRQPPYTSRVMQAVMRSLLLFYDPDYCPSHVCDQRLLEHLLQYCLQLLSVAIAEQHNIISVKRDYSVSLLCEAGSLLGHVCTLLSADVLRNRYPEIMRILSTIIGEVVPSHTHQDHHSITSSTIGILRKQTDYSMSKLRCSCLEAAALVGKSVGMDLFRPDALALATHLSRLTSGGQLDFSDEMSSFVLQTCARLAGALKAEFAPYVPLVLPAVIQHVGEDIAVELLDDVGESLTSQRSDVDNRAGKDQKEESFTVYKRGYGTIRVYVSAYALQEKVMACRVLYQFTQDLPAFLPEYVPSAILSLSRVVRSVAFDAECASVVCATFCDQLALFCRYQSPEIQTSLAQQLFETALDALMEAFELKQLAVKEGGHAAGFGSNAPFLQCILDGILEILQLLHSLRQTHIQSWNLQLPFVLAQRILQGCKDQLVLWIDCRYAQAGGGGHERAEQLDAEYTQRDLSLSCIQAVLKIFLSISEYKEFNNGTQRSLHESFVFELGQFYQIEIIPLFNNLLVSGMCSAATAPLMIVPIQGLVDSIEFMPSQRVPTSDLLLPRLLELWEVSTLTVTCVYGMGICAQYGNIEGVALTKMMAVLCQILGLDSSAPPSQLDLDDDQAQLLHEHAIGAMFRVAVFRREFLGSQVTAQLLEVVLSNLPIKQDITLAQNIHHILFQLIEARDVCLFNETLGSAPRVLSFQVAVNVVLSVVSSLRKLHAGLDRALAAILSTASTKSGTTKKKSKPLQVPDSSWQVGQQESFWSEQLVNKRTYAQAYGLVQSALQRNPMEPEILLCITYTFTKKQQKALTVISYTEKLLLS